MKLIFTLIVLFFSVELMAQKAGTLDYSFGDSGKVLTSSSTGYLDCTGGGLQSDGSIIAAGGVSFLNSNTDDFFAIKYSSNGKLDSSFGKKGLAVLKGLGEAETEAKVQPDNKIIIAGYNTDLSGSFYAITAGRFNADGSVDSAFGTNGSIANNAGEDCSDIALQPDGKLLLTGTTGIAFITLRYMPDGTLDNSFGNNGSVTTNFGNGTPKLGNANLVQSDGKIVVAGGDNERIMLARYNTDGSLDETFGNNGEVISDITNINPLNKVYDMTLQPDGKLVLTGTTGDEFGIVNTMILRYMPDGSFDTAFGNKGIVIRALQYNSDAFNMALQKDDKITISGYTIPDGVNGHFLVERYNTNGTIDSSFGNDGYQITAMDESDVAETTLLQQDGKIVLAGAAYNNQNDPSSYEVALARYNNDESKKQIIIQKIKHYIQTHNDAQATTLNAISIYPNPAQNILHVEGIPSTQNLPTGRQAKLTVVDFNGNVIVSRELSPVPSNTGVVSNGYDLNVSSLHAGNYLLKIETNGEVVTKQFVKE